MSTRKPAEGQNQNLKGIAGQTNVRNIFLFPKMRRAEGKEINTYAEERNQFKDSIAPKYGYCSKNWRSNQQTLKGGVSLSLQSSLVGHQLRGTPVHTAICSLKKGVLSAWTRSIYFFAHLSLCSSKRRKDGGKKPNQTTKQNRILHTHVRKRWCDYQMFRSNLVIRHHADLNNR